MGDTTLKKQIMYKAAEMVDCIIKIGRQDYFEITIKHVNGELVTQLAFSNTDKVSK